jgi:hypothetical protein
VSTGEDSVSLIFSPAAFQRPLFVMSGRCSRLLKSQNYRPDPVCLAKASSPGRGWGRGPTRQCHLPSKKALLKLSLCLLWWMFSGSVMGSTTYSDDRQCADSHQRQNTGGGIQHSRLGDAAGGGGPNTYRCGPAHPRSAALAGYRRLSVTPGRVVSQRKRWRDLSFIPPEVA